MIGKHASFKLDPETLSLADITFDNNYSVESNEESELGNIIKNLPSINSDIDNI